MDTAGGGLSTLETVFFCRPGGRGGIGNPAMIHINRNRENLGKFTEQEVADGLKSGKFLPSDLAWQEPMETWKPLETFTDLPTATDVVQPEAPAEPEVPAQPAWERLGWGGLVESVKQVFTAPVETFRAMPPAGGYSKPMWFYTVTAWASGMTAMGYQLAASMVNPAMFFGEYAKDVSAPVMVVIFLVMALFMPVILIAVSFVTAGLWHLALMMSGGATKPFEATYRALAYAGGASSVLQFVPLCGGYLYPVANLVYGVIALKETHRAELWRVVLAAVALMLLCCGAAMAVGMGYVALLESLGLPKPK